MEPAGVQNTAIDHESPALEKSTERRVPFILR